MQRGAPRADGAAGGPPVRRRGSAAGAGGRRHEPVRAGLRQGPEGGPDRGGPGRPGTGLSGPSGRGALVSGGEGSEADREWAAKTDPDVVEAAMRACGARLAVPGSAEYPRSLEDLTDPPAALFVRGAPVDSAGARVAVVGARRCSSLGREVATETGAG